MNIVGGISSLFREAGRDEDPRHTASPAGEDPASSVLNRETAAEIRRHYRRNALGHLQDMWNGIEFNNAGYFTIKGHQPTARHLGAEKTLSDKQLKSVIIQAALRGYDTLYFYTDNKIDSQLTSRAQSMLKELQLTMNKAGIERMTISTSHMRETPPFRSTGVLSGLFHGVALYNEARAGQKWLDRMNGIERRAHRGFKPF